MSLLVVLALVLAVGGWLLFVWLSEKPTIELVISEPVGEDVYYDVVLDDVASAGTATVPATLTYHGRQFTFAVIPKSETSADLEVVLKSPGGFGSQSGPGSTGKFTSSGPQPQVTIGPMTEVHIANMRRARKEEEEQTEN